MTSLKNKVALITGASSGIGKAIALDLLQDGALCYFVGRSQQKLDEIKASLKNEANIFFYATDITNENNVQSLVKDIEARHGSLDVLVHSAGIYRSGSIQDVTGKDFDELFTTNVKAPYMLTQMLIPLIIKAKGQVVFVNSTQGLNASEVTGQFAATQHSMRAIADSLREEVNKDGVKVVSLYLGRTATPRMESLYKEQSKAYEPSLLMQPEDVADVVLSVLHLPTTAEVTNIHMRPMMKSY